MLKRRVKVLEHSRIRSFDQNSTRFSGQRLQIARRRLFAKEPLCKGCSSPDHPVVATQRDHIVPLWQGGLDIEANTQGLCDACHEKKSNREAAERSQGARYPGAVCLTR